MTLLHTTRMKIAAVAAGGLMLVGGGTAVAFAATSGGSGTTGAPSSSPATTAPSPPASGTKPSGTKPSGSKSATGATKAGRGGGLLDRADHALVEVKQRGQWVTLTLDRGKITTVSATSLTLARPDGQSVTIALAPSTAYPGAVGSPAALQSGTQVLVTSQSGTAVSVSVHGASHHPKGSGGTSNPGTAAATTTPPTV